ncbi:guanylate kinase [Patescibacteria group bacterium]
MQYRFKKAKVFCFYGIIFSFFIVDYLVKQFFIKNPSFKQDFLFLKFDMSLNKGIAFGMPINKGILIFIIIICLLVLVAYIVKLRNKIILQSGLVCIFLGAISNFLDRILYGSVIDYISVPYFSVLNIADIMITVGVFIVLLGVIIKKNEKLIVISAPTGSGKNTVVDLLLEKNNRLEETISCATRKPRENEKNGVHYYFITEKDFKCKIKNKEFIEWANVHKMFYGTLVKEIKRIKNKNKISLLVIDVQGAMNIKKIFPDALLIFIKPNSFSNMEKRIRNRAFISEKEVHLRLETAKKELEFSKKYDYIILNPEGHPEKAVADIERILEGDI